MKTCMVRVVALAALAWGATVPAGAQNYPNRPVRIMLPFAAGGVADVTTRLVGEKLGEKLGQRFVIENVPGAGGIAAARAAIAGGPDGYTLALLTNATAISVPLFKSLPFDPFKDFTPISGIGNFDCLFVVNAEAEFRTLGDFIKAAREKPGVLNIGTISVGSTQNLSAELFKSMAGVNVVIIPFRTSPDTVVSLLRKDIQMVVDFPAALQAGLSDHKLRVVAATGPVSAKLYDAPTVAQAGVPDYEVTSWNSLYAPAGTPKEVIERLNGALREVLAEPDLKKRAFDLGIDTRAASPEEVEARMRADIKKWATVIESAHIPKQ
jgi:tripartite-type tricarboxylate transporter receptor subunit TctC